jgi:hypothetical protein
LYKIPILLTKLSHALKSETPTSNDGNNWLPLSLERERERERRENGIKKSKFKKLWFEV